MDANGSKRRRLRSGGACESCRRRKHRCDGLRPQCSNCRSRNATCEYLPVHFNPRDPSSVEYFHSLMQSTQTKADEAAPRQQSSQPQPFPLPTPLASLADSRTGPGSDSSSAVPIGTSSSTAFASSIGRLESDSELQSCSDQSVPSHSPSGAWDATEDVPGTGNVDSSHALRPEDGPLTFELPNQNLAHELVDAYFDRIHPQWPFVHEPTFRSEYESMWAAGASPVDGVYPYEDKIWYALLNMIFAHGSKYRKAENGRDHSPEKEMNIFVMRARRTILSHIHRLPSLKIVQALLLLCHYLKATAELSECRNFVSLLVHTATNLGLDFNPTPNTSKQWSTVHKELRKRVWWGCFHIDHALSAELGHPAVSRGKGTGVDFPAEVDDQYITAMSGTPRQPRGLISYTSFLVHTCRMSQIQSDVLYELYLNPHQQSRGEEDKDKSSEYQLLEAMIRFHNRLELWWKQIPPHLTQDEAETGCHDAAFSDERHDDHRWRQQRQSFLIRRYNIQLLLHRPVFGLFLRRSFRNKFLHSIAAASACEIIECAQRALTTIYSWSKHQPRNGGHNNMHFVFTSMCVLFQYQAMDSDSKTYITCTDDKTVANVIREGLNFLLMASQWNALALKYFRILQHVRKRVHSTSRTVAVIADASSTADRDNGAANYTQAGDASICNPEDITDGLWTSLEHNSVDFTELDETLFENFFGPQWSLTEWSTGIIEETTQS